MTYSISQRPSRLRRRPGLQLAILAALSCSAPLAFADTGIGIDTWRANKLDPTGGMQSQNCDADGTTWLSPLQHQSPTGNLYNCPSESPLANQIGDWLYYGVLQVGFIGIGDQNYAMWNRYTDYRNDGMPILGLFDLQFERPSDGTYAEIRASRISDDDQYYQAVYGKAGAYKIQAFVRDMPNILSTDTKSIWSGVGTNTLTLLPGLTPGGTTSAQLASVVNGLSNQTVGVTRSKQGLGGSIYLTPEWTAYLNVTNEERNGARDYGGPFGQFGGGTLSTTTLMPVKDSTINVNAGARYVGPEWHFDFSYSGSFYRDSYTSYNFQVPFMVSGETANNPISWGQMSTPPSNDYGNLQASATRKIPWDGELSISAGVGRMSQDSPIVPDISPLTCAALAAQGNPYLITAGSYLFGSVANNVLCNQWDSSASLAQSTANMRVDTAMLDVHVVLNPTSTLTLRGGVNANNQDYRGSYTDYNPLTGEYGYLPESGGSLGAGVAGASSLFLTDWGLLNGTAANNRLSNIPLSKEMIDANIGADWKITDKNTLGITLDNDHYEPQNREVQNLDTSSIKLTWINRSFDWLTLRLNYTYAEQNGGAFTQMDVGYANTLAAWLATDGNVPVANAQGTPLNLVRFDMADYKENKLDLMATFTLRDDMTLSASIRDDVKTYDNSGIYPVSVGRSAYNTATANLNWEWQFGVRSGISAYAAWDGSRLNVADQDGGAATNGVDNTATIPTGYNSQNWWFTDRERDWYGGFNYFHVFDRARLDLGWNYMYSRGLDNISYLSTTVLVPTPTTDTGPGAQTYPRTVYVVNSFTASVTVPLNNRVSLRLFDNYELGRIKDWHYDGLSNNLVISQNIYTDAGPQNYKENLIGLFMTVKL